MAWQGWVTLIVLVVSLGMLARETFAPSNTLLGAVVVLLLVKVITPSEAFSGFGNSAPLTVAALYVLARAVEKTGLMQPVLQFLLGAKPSRSSMTRLTVSSAGASAFLNNTPLVAMLIPPVTDWAQRTRQSPSRYLMPLSYAVILGGVITLIGTSTNLVVSGMLDTKTGHPMGMFEITPIGLPVCIVGLIVMISTAKWLLPDRNPARSDLGDESAREFSIWMRVSPSGSLVGQTVAEARLRSLQGVYLFQVERRGEIIAPVSTSLVLEAEDGLCFVGRVDQILDLQTNRGLQSLESVDRFDTARHTFFEVVIGASSPLLGSNLREIGFRDRYQAAVVAIHRAGHRVNSKLGEVDLKVGDTLLLLSDPGFRTRWRDRNDFLLIAPVGGTAPGITKKAWFVALVLFSVMVVAGLDVLPMLQASLVGAIALVAFGVLTASEARAAVDLDVIVMIASSFGLGAAMEKSGLASLVGHGLADGFGFLGPLGALAGIILATSLVTEFVTNNAAAAVMFPIAFASATQVGQDPRLFGVVVAVMASTSFLTPIGYQTNTMVYGPGGYRFSDYTRFGAPITIAVMITILLVARFWYGVGG